MIAAFELLGLVGELGRPGKATAFCSPRVMSDRLEFTVIPGSFTARELAELREWAG